MISELTVRIARNVKIILLGIALIIVICVTLLYASGFLTHRFSGKAAVNADTLFRSFSAIEFREQFSPIAYLTNTFGIENVDNNTVRVLLTLAFKRSNAPTDSNLKGTTQLLERVSLRTALRIFIADQWVLHAWIPPYPPTEFSLDVEESTVRVNETFDLRAFDTPTVMIFYTVGPIELRFMNGSTLLLNNFALGNCTVEPQATLDMVNEFGGLAPLWEGDDKYSPSCIAYGLAELDGKNLWRKIIVDIDRGKYSVEKIEGRLDDS